VTIGAIINIFHAMWIAAVIVMMAGASLKRRALLIYFDD
jgi:hypothetical protein